MPCRSGWPSAVLGVAHVCAREARGTAITTAPTTSSMRFIGPPLTRTTRRLYRWSGHRLPGLKSIRDPLQRRSELRIVAFQHRPHRILPHVLHPELGVDLRPVVVGEESIAFQTARSHQHEDPERGLAEPKPIR